VPLPPRYRDAFRAGVVLSQGSPDRCIRLYTRPAFEAQSERVTAVPAMLGRGRDLRRMFFSRTFDAQLDAQNRVLVPAWMREYAGLSGKVLLVGAGEWIELWSPEAYEADIARIAETFEATLESIEERRG
jgi:MraZ protein